MTQNEVNQIEGKIDSIAEYDLDEIFAGQDLKDINNLFTFKEGKKLHHQLIKTFKKAIESGILLHASNHYLKQASVTPIVNVLTNYENTLINEQLADIDTWLNEIYSYLLQSGLHDILKRDSRLDILNEAQALREENERLGKLLKSRNKEYEELAEKVDGLKQSLETYLEEKEEDYTKISTRLTEIDEIKENVETSQSTIDEAQTDILEKKESISKVDESVAVIETTLSGYQEDYTENLGKFTEQIEGYDNHKERADEIRELLDDLLSPAVAENLHRTFDNKSGKNFWPKWIWLGVSSLCLIAVTWIFIAFLEEGKTELRDIIIYVIRTSPVIFVMLFGLRQYTNHVRKEDQYDFKSAMSLSLDAYLRMLEKDDTDKNELIKSSVERIYQSPFKTTGKEKDIPQNTMDQLASLIKELGKLKGSD